jgi:hypothetical protein
MHVVHLRLEMTAQLRVQRVEGRHVSPKNVAMARGFI